MAAAATPAPAAIGAGLPAAFGAAAADLEAGDPATAEKPKEDVKFGLRIGLHGHEEVVTPGKPSVFVTKDEWGYYMAWLWILAQWPFSSALWGLLFFGQTLSRLMYSWLGEAWCYNPSQIQYIHSLYVVSNTIHKTWSGYLCCCGCILSTKPGVLYSTVQLPTPPRFIFDEDKDVAYSLTFDEYVVKKASTFPPFSGKYRAADGGGNSRRYTFIGQGGRGYGMTEPFMILQPSVLPDPEKMSRALEYRTIFKESPWGQNALSCWFANVAIHDFFRTATGADAKYTGGKEKPWVNLHSGYLDLQVLYGFNEEIARSCRSFEGGKLKKVAETRFDRSKIHESKAIVELLRREHNWVCDELARRYPEQFATDEALYQQARLIMGGVFINLILRQYGDQMFGESAPEGRGFAELRQSYGWWPQCVGKHYGSVGNHSTFNFNMIYRWHTAIPEEWAPETDPPMHTDDELRSIFLNAYNWKAGGYGPDNTPASLFRYVNVQAVATRQCRALGCPRLNDFRRRFLPPYKDFMDMCQDEVLAKRLAQFYPSVEDVELSVGVQIEQSMWGGWAIGSTVGQAVLFDAFSSIRQDRFYTTDFRPDVYTPWGYEHAKTTILVDLLRRHLQMDLPRDVMLGRVPTWRGPPEWRDISGFDARGFPVYKI